MPNYKMVDADVLDGAMLETAKAIREKGGTEELIAWNKSTGYKEAIDAITAGGASGVPNFTYTGTFAVVDDGDSNWRIRFLTSGVFTAKETVSVDVFLVGGGASGGSRSSGTGNYGSGGGSGYTKTEKRVALMSNVDYEVIVGAGGAATTGEGDGNDGGTSSFQALSANGGYKGVEGGAGGNGGSGGAGSRADLGGSDGADGSGDGGKGQGTTTREFGDASGALYSTGGNAGRTSPDIELENTGDGGDGARGGASGAGASGIVIIRNARGAA